MTSFVYIFIWGFTQVCLAYLKLNWKECSNLILENQVQIETIALHLPAQQAKITKM